MVLYESEFVIKRLAVDDEKSTYDETLGYLIYLFHDKIDGLMDKLHHTGFSDNRKKVVESIYVYADDNFENHRLCINYANGNYAFVPRKWFSVSSLEIKLVLDRAS